MKSFAALVAAALLVAPAASATKVPLPVEGATLNISFQLQTEALVNENGAPDGKGNSYDFFIRRSRILINGDINQNFSYLVQLDNPNFGKFGNFSNRAYMQDAWIGWAPTGITGGNVLYVDAGYLLIPISRHMLESTTNFITADQQTDTFRLGSQGPGFRQTGVQVRGWWLDKKIGFRGGVYEGQQPFQSVTCNTTTPPATTPSPCINAKRDPQLAGFVNFDLLGSEEGGWLYGAYKWGKEPVLSIGLSGIYQSLAVKNLAGNFTDQKFASADVYLDLPMSEAAELVAEITAYRSNNGVGSGNTGNGLSAQVGYRFGAFAPYAGYEYFQSDDCGDLTTGCTVGGTTAGGPDTANSRNFRAGVNFFFNKNLNHLNAELAVNHGQSASGNTAMTAVSAGYVPAGSGTNLRLPAQKSFLLHWNTIF